MTKPLELELMKELINASYRGAAMPEHVGNPLIEALPPFQHTEDMMMHFGRFPRFSVNERLLPDSERMLAVSRLNEYLEPLPSHYDVVEKIGLIVRAGYTYRNPTLPDHQRVLTELYRQAMEGKICQIEESTPSTAPSFALFGTSGVGKTTVIEHALSFLPQVLHHKELEFVQVVWMKLDCPPDGSLKQLLGAMLVNFDKLLGTDYTVILKHTTTIDKLILSVAKLSAIHHLGVLVIDEIQNLLDASGVGQAKMLNFFLTFANIVKIPLVTVGTPRALTLLESQFRTARRIGDHGTYLWDRFSLGDEWTFFVECLWKYQWTKQFAPLGKDFSELLYDKTQGIHALVIRLFQLSQLQAIRDGSDVLTEDLIIKVADDRFKLVGPMLDVFKNGGKKQNDKDNKTVEDLFVNGLKNITKTVDDKVKLSALKAQSIVNSQIVAERCIAVSGLLAMGLDEGLVQPIVAGLFDAIPDMTSSKAVRTILASLEGDAEADGISGVNSLKAIIQAGVESGVSPSAALTSAGVIASILRGN